MITTNIVHRVFNILFPNGGGHGTCFTIEVDQRQYLITAKHLAKHVREKVNVSIFHKEKRASLELALIGHCDGDVDISVLAANIQLSPTYPAEPSIVGSAYGQDMYFLGFPYLENDHDISTINRGFPMPFVKKAILSYMPTRGVFYLDGHNNPGFSGGPVVFKIHDKGDYKIAVVISGYRYAVNPVQQAGGIPSFAHVRENTGIIVCYDIKQAVSMIQSRPLGFPIEI